MAQGVSQERRGSQEASQWLAGGELEASRDVCEVSRRHKIIPDQGIRERLGCGLWAGIDWELPGNGAAVLGD